MDYKNGINEPLKVTIEFIKENSRKKYDLNGIEFDELAVHIIKNNYEVTEENINVFCESDTVEIDTEEIKRILIMINSKYSEDVKVFHENIIKEVKSLVTGDELEKEILDHIEEKFNYSTAILKKNIIRIVE